ncbi:MAG: MCP four helix bundle domain-containing protein [candidate division NC10 bacterium]|nr:MCP four helix bundle domain-containing protein [candidate division NC10 bacterium]
MRWFKDLKTVTKLMLGFTLVGVIMAGVGYMGVSSLGKVNGMLETLYTRDVAGLSAVKEAEIKLFTIGRDMRQSLLVDKGERAPFVPQIEKTDAVLRENLKKYENSLATAEGKAKFAEMEKTYAEYLALVKDMMKASLAGEDKAARDRLAAGAGTVRKVVEQMDGLAVIKENLAKKVYGESAALYASSRNMMLGLIAVGVLLGLALGYFIATLIAKGLRQVVEKSGQAAAGDLTVRIDLDSQDELGQMGTALNSMLQSFHDSMTEVQQASIQTASAAQQLTAVVTDLNNASQQLASGSEQLSAGAQEQASSLEETAASLEEITSTVKQNADNARQANQMAVPPP